MSTHLQADLALSPAVELSAPALLRLLACWVDELEAITRSATLSTRDDWAQHDGYQSKWRLSSFADLRRATASPASLTAATPGDDHVHLAFWPTHGADWYLRFRCDNEENPDDPICLADLLTADHHAPRLIAAAQSAGISIASRTASEFLRSTLGPPTLEGFLQRPS